MKWIKRLLILLAGLLLGSALLIAASILILEESDYKRMLGWGAEHFLDSQLVIDGPLEIEISRNLSVSSGKIFLKADDDSYQLSIGKLHANFRLSSYLQTGTFWFNNLQLEDIRLDVKETTKDNNFSLEDFKIPPVVIAQAQFTNIEFIYQELSQGALHMLLLDELAIGELGEHQPISLYAKGQFEGQPFEIQGTSNSLTQVFEDQDPLTVKLELSSTLVNAKLQGTIAEPLNGRGLDLIIQGDISEVRDIIEIGWLEFPLLGSLQGSLNVRGDYVAPRLEAIDLHLQRGQEADLVVKGSVADARSGTGLDLQVEARSSNPQALSWLLFKKHDLMQTVHVSGTLRRDAVQFSLHDLNASAETADGTKLQVNGSTVVYPQGHRLTQADAGLAVQFSAPTLATVNLLEIDEISELGPASGSLKLALGMDALAIYNADIEIGNRKQSLMMLKGDIGYVQLLEELDLSELNLLTDIQTAQIAQLGKQLNYELPELGPARLQGKLVTQGSELILQDAKLNIGTKGQPILLANGLLATQLRDPKNFRLGLAVDLPASAFSRLGELFDYTLPELGPTHITGSLEATKSELHFKEGLLVVGTTHQPTIRTDFMLTTQLGKGSTINTKFDMAVAQLIAAFSDMQPKDLGRLQGDAIISDLDGEWGIESISLASAQTGLYHLQLSGNLKDGKPVLDGNFNIPVLRLEDINIGPLRKDKESEPSKDKSDSPHVFSRKPLDFEFLNAVDLDLLVSIDKVESEKLTINSIESQLELKNGHLIAPVHLVFEGGDTDINLDMRMAALPEYKLSIDSDNVSLGPLMAQVSNEIPIHGYSDIQLDLNTRGKTLHEMASSLSGNVDIELENIRIPKELMEILSVDIFGWVLSKSVAKQTHYNLNCVVLKFAINAGEVESKAIISDGPNMSIGGKIDMNLGEETLDIVLIPKQKKRLFASSTPVKIQGPMKEPKVDAIPAKVAIQEIGTLALLPGVFIPLRAGEKLWSLLSKNDNIGGGCENVHSLREPKNE